MPSSRRPPPASTWGPGDERRSPRRDRAGSPRAAPGRQPLVDGQRGSDHPARRRAAAARSPRAPRRDARRPLRGQGAGSRAAAGGRSVPARAALAHPTDARRRPAARARPAGAHRHRPRPSLARPLAVAAGPAPRRRRDARAAAAHLPQRPFGEARRGGRRPASAHRRASSRCRDRSRRAAARSDCPPSAWCGSRARPTCRASAVAPTAGRSATSSSWAGPRSSCPCRDWPPTAGTSCSWPAFGRLLERMPEARLLLVGKGERRDRLEQLVAELGLGHRVIFTGYRDRDLPQVLAAARLLRAHGRRLRRVVPGGAGGDGGGAARDRAPCRRAAGDRASTARPGCWSTASGPRTSRRHWPPCSPTRPGRARWARRAAARRDGVQPRALGDDRRARLPRSALARRSTRAAG